MHLIYLIFILSFYQIIQNYLPIRKENLKDFVFCKGSKKKFRITHNQNVRFSVDYHPAMF